MIHQIVVRSPLGRRGNITEYQVHQTRRGVEVLLRLIGEIDLGELPSEIASGLSTAGLVEPEVALTPVDELQRHGSGKIKRIVRLPGPS